jgi:2-isopropylmalate synthase
VGDALGDVTLGIHVHDDAGLAVANSLAAVQAGVTHVQGTINGYGERCGNANLVTIWANLALKLGRPTVPAGDDLRHLPELSRFVAEVVNIAPDAHAPYVGTSAFAHKGGVHGAATVRVEQAYQHVEPAVVGGTSRLVVSELGGKANAAWRVRQLGSVATEGLDPAELSKVVKQLEAEGASFEGADASFELLVRRRHPDYVAPFRIVDFTVIVERRNGASPRAEASVKVEVDGEVFHTAADGNGPVNALDLAMRKALAAFYPALDGVHLVDYKVRILDGEAATAARTRVIIESAHQSGTWTTAGADANIIAASVAALHDSLEYAIWRLDARLERRDERAAAHAAARRPVPEPATEATPAGDSS